MSQGPCSVCVYSYEKRVSKQMDTAGKPKMEHLSELIANEVVPVVYIIVLGGNDILNSEWSKEARSTKKMKPLKFSFLKTSFQRLIYILKVR